MVKKQALFCLFLTLLLFTLPLSVSAGSIRVYDLADLFTDGEEAELESEIAAFTAETGMDFVVLTSNDAGSGSSLDYADLFYENRGFGKGEDRDGILYFIDMDNRVPTISTTGYMIDLINDYRLENLLDAAYDELVEGDYADSAEAVLELTAKYCRKGLAEGSYRYDTETGEQLTAKVRKLTGDELFFSLAAGVGLFLLLFFSIRSGYTVKQRHTMYNAAANGICNVANRTDRFLHQNVVVHRAPPPSDRGSGGFGGGFSGGGSGVHHSSSGMSHGGGSGRRF